MIMIRSSAATAAADECGISTGSGSREAARSQPAEDELRKAPGPMLEHAQSLVRRRSSPYEHHQQKRNEPADGQKGMPQLAGGRGRLLVPCLSLSPGSGLW
jgi:hypothetical protein